MFCYSTIDEVVKEEDVLELYESFKGRKKLFQIEGTFPVIEARHHQDRPKSFIDEGANFVWREKERREGKICLGECKKGISLSTRKKIKE